MPQSLECNPLPEVSMWTTDSLRRLVSATIKELLRRHPMLVPLSIEKSKQPEGLATPQEENSQESNI